MNNRAAYEALVLEHSLSGWPEHYTDDLFVHDQCTIHDLPEGACFGWLVRNTGTWLIKPRDLFQSLYPSHDWSQADGSILLYAANYEPHRCYYWDGKQLLGALSARHLESMLNRPATRPQMLLSWR